MCNGGYLDCPGMRPGFGNARLCHSSSNLFSHLGFPVWYTGVGVRRSSSHLPDAARRSSHRGGLSPPPGGKRLNSLRSCRLLSLPLVVDDDDDDDASRAGILPCTTCITLTLSIISVSSASIVPPIGLLAFLR